MWCFAWKTSFCGWNVSDVATPLSGVISSQSGVSNETTAVIRVATCRRASPDGAAGDGGVTEGPGPLALIGGAAPDGEFASRHTPIPTITRIDTTTKAHPGI